MCWIVKQWTESLFSSKRQMILPLYFWPVMIIFKVNWSLKRKSILKHHKNWAEQSKSENLTEGESSSDQQWNGYWIWYLRQRLFLVVMVVGGNGSQLACIIKTRAIIITSITLAEAHTHWFGKGNYCNNNKKEWPLGGGGQWPAVFRWETFNEGLKR